MVAGIIDQQEPAILILIELHIFMRELPQQKIKGGYRTWRIDLLADIAAALGSALLAFVLLFGGHRD